MQNLPSDSVEPVEQGLLTQRETGQAMVIRGLKKHFGEKKAVDGLDLDIFEG